MFIFVTLVINEVIYYVITFSSKSTKCECDVIAHNLFVLEFIMYSVCFTSIVLGKFEFLSEQFFLCIFLQSGKRTNSSKHNLIMEYGIFGEGSQISTNWKRGSTVFSLLIG